MTCPRHAAFAAFVSMTSSDVWNCLALQSGHAETLASRNLKAERGKTKAASRDDSFQFAMTSAFLQSAAGYLPLCFEGLARLIVALLSCHKNAFAVCSSSLPLIQLLVLLLYQCDVFMFISL